MRFSTLDRWYDEERAAEAKATFLGVGTLDEDDVEYVSGQSFLAKLRNRVVGRKYDTYHRAANKFHKRVRVLRELRETMLFMAVGHKRERTPLNVAAAEELARKVVSQEFPHRGIHEREARWYRAALVEVFFVKDDDDEFLARLGGAPAPARA